VTDELLARIEPLIPQTTLKSIPIKRPMVWRYHHQHLCLDAAYVGDEVATIAQAFRYTLHVRPRGAEATGVQKRAASGGVLAVTCG
jgi:hypothetical protein